MIKIERFFQSTEFQKINFLKIKNKDNIFLRIRLFIT